jgi:DNA-binding GntR family transcriptional regulator
VSVVYRYTTQATRPPYSGKADKAVVPTQGSFLGSRRKLGEECARYLRDAVMSGGYSSGDKLVVEEIAQELGVSSMPVREALITLANEGLVDELPRRGFRVAAIKRRDIDDVFRVHAHVAGLLAAEAATLIQRPTLHSLREVQESITNLGGAPVPPAEQGAEIEKLNFVLHRTINHVPDAERLRWFLRAASRYVPRYFYERIPGWVDASIRDHPAIISALENHDADAARELMEDHVLRAGRLVVSHLSKSDFWIPPAALT